MARQLSEAQVAEVAEAVRSVPDIQAPGDLRKVAAALRSSSQTAFTADDIASIEAGIDALDQPLESRPRWPAEKGRGLFFVFEGLDRSGKSTQSRKLREHMQAVNGEESVKWMCFPNRETPIGCLIDLYLHRLIELGDGAIHLLFSANRWEMAPTIVGELSRGVSVVCDRYAFSGVAYSAAKGLDFEWCQAPDRGLPCPDGVFFMRVEPEVGAARANFGDERYENASFQTSVRAEFQLPRLHSGVAWQTIDGSRGIEEVHEEIKIEAAALGKVGQDGGKAVQSLWVQQQ
mmetsp:Transcript_28308/g.81292  ORF Transcript_28308/g.81292 Transcript_28308/m.81292 type:complete len:289 (+) Transcript_28308:98-964(+)